MVFSTVPVYHQDPPNWHLHLQQNLQQESTTRNNPQPQQQQQVLPPPPPSNYTGGGGGSDGVTSGSIRPGSMSDRARLAKIPQPEAALKCPRCESTNTKFCYFNNYNLSQPRHFCKMCRRYWTRGGALRNVPVGGGCRRNKKSKSSKTKASGSTTSNNNSSTDQRHKITSSSSTSTDLAAPRSDHDHDNYIMGHHNYYPQQPPQLPFLSSLQNLTHFGGLNLRSINPALSGQNSILSTDQWSSMQQFPFLAGGFESSAAGAILGNNPVARGVAASSMPMMTSGASRVCDQVMSSGAVKMEETLNSGKAAKPFLGIVNDNNDQYYSSWGGGSSTWNNPIGSADDDEDNQLTGQQLNSSAATAHYL